MNVLIINLCSQSLHYFEFVKPVEDIIRGAGQDFLTKHYSKINSKDIESSSRIIICGTSLKDFEYQKAGNAFEFIKDYDRPILGICAGMQMICSLFGCRIIEEKEIGMKGTVFDDFLGMNGEKEIYCLHTKAVDEDDALKKEFIIKAKTSCVQALVHKHRQICCTLFHPEVRNKIFIEQFINNNFLRR